MELQAGRVYRIRLCSGEVRRWRYEGVDGRDVAWWRDEDSGLGFSESALMYVWEVIGDDTTETDGTETDGTEAGEAAASEIKRR